MRNKTRLKSFDLKNIIHAFGICFGYLVTTNWHVAYTHLMYSRLTCQSTTTMKNLYLKQCCLSLSNVVRSKLWCKEEVLFLMLITLIITIELSTLINNVIGIVFLFQRKIEWNQSLYSQTVFINVSALIPFSCLLSWHTALSSPPIY